MRLAASIAFATYLLCSASFAAQFVWEDEACKNTITFDAAKVDAQALKNTASLLFSQSVLRTPASAITNFSSPEQTARANLAELQNECAEIAQAGKSLKLLPLPGLEDFRAMLLEDTRDACELADVKICALKDPSVLRSYAPAVPVCSTYIDALEGKTDFEQTWRDTVETSLPKKPATGRMHEQAFCRCSTARRSGAQTAFPPNLRLEQLRRSLHEDQCPERRARCAAHGGTKQI